MQPQHAPLAAPTTRYTPRIAHIYSPRITYTQVRAFVAAGVWPHEISSRYDTSFGGICLVAVAWRHP